MNGSMVFRDREHAAELLADELRARGWHDVLVLGVPRGGVVTGAVVARALGAEFDVVLARKLRAPGQPELALGAVAEGGHTYMDPMVGRMISASRDHIEQEKSRQMAEIARRQSLFRGLMPPAPIEGRTVIVTDDGVATGSTLIAALLSVRERRPARLIAAVPVSAPDSLPDIRAHCDEVVCLMAPGGFQAVGQYYLNFNQVEDAEAVAAYHQARAEFQTAAT